MISDYARLVTRRVAEARAALAESIARGAATDYAAYREAVGRVKALDEALAVIADTQHQLLDDDDE